MTDVGRDQDTGGGRPPRYPEVGPASPKPQPTYLFADVTVPEFLAILALFLLTLPVTYAPPAFLVLQVIARLLWADPG